MPEARRGGKKGRKHGRNARKPTFLRYHKEERNVTHALRHSRRRQAMVEESTLRRAERIAKCEHKLAKQKNFPRCPECGGRWSRGEQKYVVTHHGDRRR